MHIPLSAPELNDNDKAAVLEVLNSGSLSLGPKVPLFERMAASIAGTRYAIAINSGTSGLHLCIKTARIADGDEVITTPFSFVASANCILFERATPVFVDIDPLTYNLDCRLIESAITARTKAILIVHVFGRPCNMNEIARIASRHGLVVIEDSCEAIGARYRGKPVGSFGATGVFAFYPNKQITTGEGGVIVTSDDEIARQCRSLRNQGRSENEGWLEHDRLGYNYRISDISCALGLSQLSRLGEILSVRRQVAQLYDEGLRDISEVIRPQLHETDCDISWFVYVVRLRDEFTREDRNQILSEMAAQGIACRNYFPPIHLQPFYRERFDYHQGAFPVTEHVADRTIALPFFNRLSESQIDYVCRGLRNVCNCVLQKRFIVAGSAAVAR